MENVNEMSGLGLGARKNLSGVGGKITRKRQERQRVYFCFCAAFTRGLLALQRPGIYNPPRC